VSFSPYRFPASFAWLYELYVADGRIVHATSPQEIAREFGADLSAALRESLSTPALGDMSLIHAGRQPR
jgi:hypothetical protein